MTHPTTGALASLLGPTSAAVFAADVWSQRLLHRSAAPDERLTDLLTLDDVDTLLASHALRTPFLRVAKDGVVVPASTYTRSGGIGASIADQVDADRLAALLADGSTLVLQGLHRAWPRVQALVTDLTVDLGHPVQANAYLTPPAAQGFSAHYDTHDVFVVQLAGSKHWTVHPPAVSVETGLAEWTQHRDAVAAATQGEPAYDAPLAPGDVLYLPRGWIHSARANDTMSLHLTLGIHPWTARHVLDAAVADAMTSLPVHTSLPVGVDVADPADVEAVLEQVRRSLVDALDAVKADAVAQRLSRRRDADVRRAPLRPVQQVGAATSDLDVRVMARAGFAAAIEPSDETVVVRADGRELRLPASQEDAVRAALSGAVVGDRPLPGLDPDESRALVRRLLLAGLVVPA